MCGGGPHIRTLQTRRLSAGISWPTQAPPRCTGPSPDGGCPPSPWLTLLPGPVRATFKPPSGPLTSQELPVHRAGPEAPNGTTPWPGSLHPSAGFRLRPYSVRNPTKGPPPCSCQSSPFLPRRSSLLPAFQIEQMALFMSENSPAENISSPLCKVDRSETFIAQLEERGKMGMGA